MLASLMRISITSFFFFTVLRMTVLQFGVLLLAEH